jgi:hypothetical protein
MFVSLAQEAHAHGSSAAPRRGLVSWRRDAPAMRREIGQLLWAVLLLDLVVVALGYATRAYFGDWALAVTLGLAAFVTTAFLLILVLNLAGAALVDAARAVVRRLPVRRGARSGAPRPPVE